VGGCVVLCGWLVVVGGVVGGVVGNGWLVWLVGGYVCVGGGWFEAWV